MRDAIIAAKRTLDTESEYNSPQTPYNPATLSLGRQLAGYVIAADLIDLPTMPAAVGEPMTPDAEFRPWLNEIRDVELFYSNATYGKSLRKTYENWAH